MREEVERVLSKYAGIELTYESPLSLEYVVTSGSIERYFPEVYGELVSLGYQPLLTAKAGHEILKVFKVGLGGISKIMSYTLVLITTIAIAVTGYFSALSFYECIGVTAELPLSVLMFTLSVLVPLALHELGHFTVSRRTRVPTPLPLFIPAPLISPLGTFGAVITVRFLPRDRRSLALLGLSGPLVGVVVSFIALLLTLRMSPVIRPDELKCVEVVPLGFAPMSMYLMLISGLIPRAENEIILLHPAALASMLLLLIHFANLLPVGQLDGGHILRSVTNVELHRVVSVLVPVVFIFISFFVPAYRWLGFFSILAILISGFRPHIGYANQLSELSSRDRFLLLLIYLLLLIATVPVPL